MDSKHIIVKVKVPVDENTTSKHSKKSWENYIETVLNSFQYEWDLNLQMSRFINEASGIMKSQKGSSKKKIEKFLEMYSQYRMESYKNYKEFTNKPNYYDIQR